MKRIAFIFLFLFIYSLFAYAQKRPPQPVKVRFLPAESASAGRTIEAKLQVSIDKGWHIFSEKPEVEGIKPTQVLLDSSDAYTVSKIVLPVPETVRSSIFDQDLKLYHNEISITLFIMPSSAGEMPIKGALTFQACSDKLCLPPAKQVFSGTQVVQ